MRRGISFVGAVVMLIAGMGGSRTYGEMAAAEKVSFLERETARATALLAEDGKGSAVTPELLLLVKREVDDYVSRSASTDARPWHDSLRSVLDRGEAYEPGIGAAFRAEGLPPALGVYVAMIESEYHPCLESPMGAKGVFQFLPKTAERFGVAAEDLCDFEKSATAAARYLKTLRAEFGTSGRGALLSVLAYNQGERKVREAFAGDPDLWRTLSRNPNAEATRYVPRLLAAVVIGENPSAFGL
jgi:membrane-bound lytic murein transglycosylase D